LVHSASTIQTIRENIKKEVAGLYPDREIDSIIEVLCQHRLDLRRHEIGLRKHEILMPPDLEWFKTAISKLREMVPVQYITGETEFFELHLKVGPAALIPRQETEELVKWIIDDHKGERCRILDLGTGTGCIALALAKNFPGAAVYGTDIHSEALDLARDNARKLGLDVEFIIHDFSREDPPLGFSHLDLIVSNPPYVPLKEMETMDANVRDFEPASALFVPDEDPLVFYRHIAGFGQKALRPGGMLYLEIHENFGQQLIELLQKSGFDKVLLRKDINGKDRMVRATIR
jgi:release factor glutamine methyltransferase